MWKRQSHTLRLCCRVALINRTGNPHIESGLEWSYFEGLSGSFPLLLPVRCVNMQVMPRVSDTKKCISGQMDKNVTQTSRNYLDPREEKLILSLFCCPIDWNVSLWKLRWPKQDQCYSATSQWGCLPAGYTTHLTSHHTGKGWWWCISMF